MFSFSSSLGVSNNTKKKRKSREKSANALQIEGKRNKKIRKIKETASVSSTPLIPGMLKY